jgi:hypothetical protein
VKALQGPEPRRSLRWIGGIGLVALCLWLFSRPLLTGIASVLIVDQQPETADNVWIRAGRPIGFEGYRCLDEAARLYRENPARSILCVPRYPDRVVQLGVVPSFPQKLLWELRKRGVPTEAVVYASGQTQTTWDEARALQHWLTEHPATTIVALSGRFSSRRFGIVLNSVLTRDERARVMIAALPDREFDETDWWQSRTGFKHTGEELIRLLFVACLGEQAPVACPQDPDEYERMLTEEWTRQ